MYSPGRVGCMLTCMPEPDVLTERPELTSNMTRTDLVEVLEHLPWSRGGRCTIRLDRDVRDYLLRILKQR
jgi:hypothetical protein